jgi:hypothetical protein
MMGSCKCIEKICEIFWYFSVCDPNIVTVYWTKAVCFARRCASSTCVFVCVCVCVCMYVCVCR